MADINWQDDEQKHELAHAESKKLSLLSSSSQLWIASTMILIGIIAGFSVGKFTAC